MAENNALWDWGDQKYYHEKIKQEIDTKLDNVEYITQEEYNALGDEKYTNDIPYIITDAENQTDTTYINNGDAVTLASAKEYANGIISNPNLLDNPDFSINQRGQTEYAGGGYCVDRWETTPTVSISDGKIVLNNKESGYSSFFQKVPLLSDLRGKTITASLLTEEVGLTVLTFKLPSIGVFIGDEAIGGLGSLRIGTVDSVSGLLLFDIRLNPTSALTIVHAKLELGSVATAFVPPNPVTELAKCQRYYQRVEQARIRAWGYTTNSIPFFVPYPEMRIRPTATIKGSPTISSMATTAYADFSCSVDWTTTTGCKITAVKTAHGLTDGLLHINSDLNVYIELSADL